MAQDIIDQLSSLVSEFITRTTAKVRKDFREILITILILHISLLDECIVVTEIFVGKIDDLLLCHFAHAI